MRLLAVTGALVASPTRAPAYWYGPASREHELGAINTWGREGLGFSYGKFSCSSSSGCSALGGMATARRDLSDLGADDFAGAALGK
jgi:hypothetical protein